ncbi:alpha/beta fold hydrolase [Stella sp.]|uniref:alpha/beta fold hydrolase n=1 Tax=Stella sp. TaxID=2912054 RepID=UPI0035B25698
MTPPLAVAAIGGFHVGGRPFRVAGQPPRMAAFAPNGPTRPFDPNGDFMVGQMYVQYVRLAAPRSPRPLLLWHGGGMTGVTWEDTPDGRPGWQQLMLEAGHDVYVADATERGRASWFPYPGVMPGDPVLRPMQEMWATFRLGPPEAYPTRTPFPGQQFPVERLEALARQVVPRWPGNEAATLAAYEALLDRLGPAEIVAHSQGCGFALAAARGGPERVAACVLLEPSGAPDPATVDLAAAARVPHLAVWGDFFAASPVWQAYRAAFERYAAALRAAGGTVEILDLPAIGIRGNSHMLTMDGNSAEIAALVAEWLGRRPLAKVAAPL